MKKRLTPHMANSMEELEFALFFKIKGSSSPGLDVIKDGLN